MKDFIKEFFSELKDGLIYYALPVTIIVMLIAFLAIMVTVGYNLDSKVNTVIIKTEKVIIDQPKAL